MEADENSIAFLDIKIQKEHNRIVTDIFYKPTDTKQYLNYQSSHPNNVPYNLARRICTIIKSESLRSRRLDELKIVLLKQKYPVNVIEWGIQKAKSIPIEELRTSTQNAEESNKVIPFVTTFNKSDKDMFKIINMGIGILEKSGRMQRVLQNKTLIKSSRQPPNIKNLLTRAKFSSQLEFYVTKCGNKRCKLCVNIIEGKEFNFTTVHKIIKVNGNMNCNVLNCVYVMVCNGCQKLYIGQSSNFRLRVNLHRDHISHNTGLNVSRHIAECAKDRTTKFKIMPFYKVTIDSKQERENREKQFIQELKPELNRL